MLLEFLVKYVSRVLFLSLKKKNINHRLIQIKAFGIKIVICELHQHGYNKFPLTWWYFILLLKANTNVMFVSRVACCFLYLFFQQSLAKYPLLKCVLVLNSILNAF